jgi:uncharacterized SAM-binding protein YcdF (DUF218 family)
MANPVKSKRRQRFKRLLFFVFIGGLLYFFSFILAIHFVGATDRTEEADIIIVLGAGLRRDGRPAWALTRRAERAAVLWVDGIAPMVLCTGAQAEGHPRSEADGCREVLMRQGVPESVILMEENSRSTEENALYSNQILSERGLSSAVLVSDSYHMLRSEWIFRDIGITAYTSPVPANRINYPLFYPYSLVREFLAFHWYEVKKVFNISVTHIDGV